MSDYNFEIIKASVIGWFDQNLSKLKNKNEMILSKNSDDALVIDFDFPNCIAQLSVTNSQFVPYQFVYFEAMDTEILGTEEMKPIYCFFDDVTMKKVDVMNALDEAVRFCSQYKTEA